MAKIEKNNILNENPSIIFLESFKDLGMKFYWKNLIFNRDENNKDFHLNVFMVSVGFSSSGCDLAVLRLKVRPKSPDFPEAPLTPQQLLSVNLD